MEGISRYYYELAFENRFLKFKGMEFQRFFSELMGLAYPGDFKPVRPWGKDGDQKCDGLLSSKMMLFQVYAPNELEQAKTLAKIEVDFHGAVAHWAEHFETWTFVHNSTEGLSPEVTKALGNLKGGVPAKKVEIWSHSELRNIVFELRDSDINKLLGPPLTTLDVLHVSMKDLKPILDSVARADIPADADVRPVPPDKLRHNKLSDGVAQFLALGVRKSRLVDDYFRNNADPQLGDKVAESFRAQYRSLKEVGLDPDAIFRELWKFTCGTGLDHSPKHEAAVLAVLAHLFERCDIFERPETGALGSIS